MSNVSRCLSMRMALIALMVAVVLISTTLRAHAFDSGRVGFAVKFKDVRSDLSVMTSAVLPGEAFRIEVAGKDRRGTFHIRVTDGIITDSSAYAWAWRAPKSTGLYHLTVYRSQPADSMTINIFVMVPYSQMKKGYLNGYHIGNYPKIPYRGLAVYEKPKGFIEVTAENEATHLSPHFTLGQFVCKQAGGYPKYVVIREVLLLKLELILRKVNQAGYTANTFAVLSGYRTPNYNRAIGNVKYSRHQWGGAADIFIDENPKDDMMDDLNKDGIINWRDAAVIYTLIDDMQDTDEYEGFIGGLARYRKTADHGPFVHVDVRGFRARWGD